ncbi:MAG TPA: hypothetical protein VNE39_19900 [Planctomycetota bacterium]|nr:hypothetical protein [Planctomycetota bacterium]
MTASEVPTSALLGISVVLVGIIAIALSLSAGPEQTAAADSPASRPVPPIDAAAPQATQTATFAMG